MPLSDRQAIILLLLLFLIYLTNKKQSPLTSTKYAANPLITIESLFRKPGQFRNLAHLETHLFIQYVVAPLIPSIADPRDYLIRDDYAAYGFVQRLRRCQVTDIMRIFRHC